MRALFICYMLYYYVILIMAKTVYCIRVRRLICFQGKIVLLRNCLLRINKNNYAIMVRLITKILLNRYPNTT